MKKKVILVICLIVVLAIGLFILTGCGNKKEDNKVTNNTQTVQENGSTANSVANTTNNVVAPSNAKHEYTYTNGVLTQIVNEEGNPKQTDFVIDGIILVGNRHSYEEMEAGAEGIMAKLVQKGYKKEGINSSFYLNEYIEFYIDTKYTGSVNDVKILVTPHRTVEELEGMSLASLEELAGNNGGFVLDYQTPEADNYKYVGNGYVNMDYPEGNYDILFTYKGKLAYFINITETKEPTE